MQGHVGPSGALSLRLVPSVPSMGDKTPILRLLALGLPSFRQNREVNLWRLRNLPNLWRGAWRIILARVFKLPHHYGALYLRHIRKDGTIVDLGLASLRVVTTAGVGFLVDALQNIVEAELMHFHGIGTTNTAENVTDTALAAESTTALNPDNTRASGTQVEGASANIYRTVGTLTADASIAAVEHGVFSTSATGSGVLLDRSIFTVVNLASGDSLQCTYELTIAAGG